MVNYETLEDRFNTMGQERAIEFNQLIKNYIHGYPLDYTNHDHYLSCSYDQYDVGTRDHRIMVCTVILPVLEVMRKIPENQTTIDVLQPNRYDWSFIEKLTIFYQFDSNKSDQSQAENGDSNG